MTVYQGFETVQIVLKKLLLNIYYWCQLIIMLFTMSIFQ